MKTLIDGGIEVFRFLLKSRLDRAYPLVDTFSTEPSFAVDMAQNAIDELRSLRKSLDERSAETVDICEEVKAVLIKCLKHEHRFPRENQFFAAVRLLIAKCDKYLLGDDDVPF